MHFSILTNAQSRGIVKRLVTYYDESQNEGDRSRYVYNKVGDFPIVQLKKTEIKRKLVRSSSVRIAPPIKSVLNRDIRAAIIRSNSFQLGANVPKLMPTRMRAKDDSHQIITNHEPLPIDESPQSAKSVLDALEKNCRKRINNEELTLDRNKRICATTTQQEVVDAPSSLEFAPIAPQSVKRNREQVSPNQSSVGDSSSDQLRKKFRTRNNALLSSLSSSNFILKPYNLTSSPSLPAVRSAFSTSVVANQSAIDIDRTEKPLIETASAPLIISAPPEKKDSETNLEPTVKRLHLFNRKIDSTSVIRRTHSRDDDDDDDVPKIKFVKPREKSEHQDQDIIRQAEKEKLSMMLSGLSEGFKSPTAEFPKDLVDSAVPKVAASISFTTSTTSSTVAPISTPALSSSALPSISVTSSLLIPSVKASGTSKQTEVATTAPLTVTTTSTVEVPKAVPSFQFGSKAIVESTTAATLPSSIIAPLSITVAQKTTASVPPLAMFSTPQQQMKLPTPSIDPNKSLISFTPVAKPAEISIVPAAVSTSSSIVPASIAPSLPAMSSGFSFGSTKEAPKVGFSFGSSSSGFGSSSSLTSNLSAVPSIPAAVSEAPSLTTSAPSFSFPSAPTPAFSFSQKPTTTPSTTGITGISPFASSSGNLTSTVSFIQKPETTTASGVGFSFSGSQAAPAATTASSGFGFGSTQSPLVANAMSVPATTSSSFSFGGSATSAFGQPSTTASGFAQKSIAPAVPVMFSFGQKTSAPATTASKFGLFDGSGQTTTAQSSGFGFGQTSQAAQPIAPIQSTPSGGGIFSRLGDKQQEAKSAFSFGGNVQTQQPSAPSMFGSVSNVAQPSAPLFGSTGGSAFNQPSTTPSGSNLFGATQPTDFGGASKPFSFSSSSSNLQQAQPAPQGSSTGMFSFGGGSAAAQSSPPSGVFGANLGQNVSASFNFKPSTGIVSSTAAPSVFGQTSAGPPPAYQFGGAPPSSSNVSASFTFGGASATSQNAPMPSGGFNFSGPQSAPTGGSNFNFQPQQQQPLLTPQPSTGGLFTIGTGGNQQQRRPIRQATRRMK